MKEWVQKLKEVHKTVPKTLKSVNSIFLFQILILIICTF